MFYEAPTLDQAFATCCDYSYLIRKNTNTSDPHDSKCGLWICVPWERARNLDSEVPPQTYWIRNCLKHAPQVIQRHGARAGDIPDRWKCGSFVSAFPAQLRACSEKRKVAMVGVKTALGLGS